MSYAGKKVLVTGADGFIGSHLTEHLVRAGASVRAFVFYNSFNSWGWLDHSQEEIRREIDVFAGDIRDPNGVRSALSGCDIVFHLAALIGIPFSYHSPDSYIDTNVKGTLNVVQAARQLGLERMVHTSTSEVYGTAQRVPIDEKHPLQGQSPYSASKIGADQLALSFWHAFQTPVTVLRPFNTYGPRQSARAVIPTIITQIATGERRLQLGALSPTRDFSFITDTVRGFAAAGLVPQAIGQVINLGTNFEISIGDLLQVICAAMQVDAVAVADEQRRRPDSSEVYRLWADNSLAEKLLGWKPSYTGPTGLRQGINETVQWFMLPENLKHYKSRQYNI